MIIRACMKNFPGEQHLLTGDNSDSKELFGKRIQSVSHEQDDSVIHIGKEKHSAGLTNVILETHYMHYCVLSWSSWHSAMRTVSGSHGPVSSSRSDPKPPQCQGCTQTLLPVPFLRGSTCGSHFSQLGIKQSLGVTAKDNGNCSVLTGLCHTPTHIYWYWTALTTAWVHLSREVTFLPWALHMPVKFHEDLILFIILPPSIQLPLLEAFTWEHPHIFSWIRDQLCTLAELVAVGDWHPTPDLHVPAPALSAFTEASEQTLPWTAGSTHRCHVVTLCKKLRTWNIYSLIDCNSYWLLWVFYSIRDCRVYIIASGFHHCKYYWCL